MTSMFEESGGGNGSSNGQCSNHGLYQTQYGTEVELVQMILDKNEFCLGARKVAGHFKGTCHQHPAERKKFKQRTNQQ